MPFSGPIIITAGGLQREATSLASPVNRASDLGIPKHTEPRCFGNTAVGHCNRDYGTLPGAHKTCCGTKDEVQGQAINPFVSSMLFLILSGVLAAWAGQMTV